MITIRNPIDQEYLHTLKISTAQTSIFYDLIETEVHAMHAQQIKMSFESTSSICFFSLLKPGEKT